MSETKTLSETKTSDEAANVTRLSDRHGHVVGLTAGEHAAAEKINREIGRFILTNRPPARWRREFARLKALRRLVSRRP
jgi:hypothetical protein